jgi:hypothetical protein
MEQRPKPDATAEQQSTGHEPKGRPTDERRTPMRLVHQMYNLARLQAGNVNIALQNPAASGPSIPSPFAPTYFQRASPLSA